MIRTIEILLPRLGERRHGLSRKLTGCGERRVAGVGLVQPRLGSGAVGWRERIQFAASLGHIIAQRGRRDPRDHGTAIVADGVGALDADQFRGASLQAVDEA
jgi:hypothetical protein